MSTKVLEVLEKSPITDFPDTVLFVSFCIQTEFVCGKINS